MRTDRETDQRSCPQPSCHGTLALLDEEHVHDICCSTCRCTPDGTYVAPDRRDVDDSDQKRVVQTNSQGQCVQFHFFYGESIIKGSDGPANWFSHRDTYDNSERTRMSGGYERVYDEDEDARPFGVDDSYTFDLSTL